MPGEYQFAIFSPYGQFVTYADPIEFSYIRREKVVGNLSVALDGAALPYDAIQRDMIIIPYRNSDGLPPYPAGNTMWFVRKKRLALPLSGERVLELYAEDTNTILRRRIVAYPADDLETDKTNTASALLYEIMRENFGNLAIAGRDLSTYLRIEIGPSIGATLDWAGSYIPVSQALQEISDASEQFGTYLTYEIETVRYPDPHTSSLSVGFELAFRVYGTQRGADRRWTTSNNTTLLIGPDFGNMTDCVIEDDWIQEENYLYAGGEGDNDDRLMVEVSDPQATIGPFGRSEGWFDDREKYITAELTDSANAELNRRTSKTRISGAFQESSQIVYGRDFKFGDYVTVQANGRGFSCRAVVEQVRYNRRDGEDLKILLEGEAT